MRRRAVEWAERLRPLGLAVGAVVDLDYALDSEYVARRGTVVTIPTDGGPLRMVGNPIRVDGADEYRPPPRLHEHTEEILGEAKSTKLQLSTCFGASTR